MKKKLLQITSATIGLIIVLTCRPILAADKHTKDRSFKQSADVLLAEDTIYEVSPDVDGMDTSFTLYPDADFVEQAGYSFPRLSDTLMEQYRASSPTYLKIELQHDSTTEKYKQYEENMEYSEKQIKSLIKSIQAAKLRLEEHQANGNLLGVIECEALLKSYRLQLDSQKSSYAKSALERDLLTYDMKMSEQALSELQRLAEYQFYSTYSSLPLLNRQVKYQEKKVNELYAAVSDEEIKLNLGYSTDLAVLNLRAELEAAKANLTEANNFLAYTNQSILANCGDAPLSFAVPLGMEKVESEQEYQNRFSRGNTPLSRMKCKLEAYARYEAYTKKQPSLLEEETSSEETATDDLLVKNRKELDLSIQEYSKITIPLYIAKQLDMVEQTSADLRSVDAALLAAEKQEKANELLLDQGRITDLEQKKLQTQIAKIELEKAQILYQRGLTAFILEYGILLQ